jgi:hypothetical protein
VRKFIATILVVFLPYQKMPIAFSQGMDKYKIRETVPDIVHSEGPSKSDTNLMIGSQNPTLKSGNLFVSSKKKDELLLRANIWGAVQTPGIHYFPVGTSLLNAISIAGGPSTDADLDDVSISTSKDGLSEIKKLSLQEALKGGPESNPEILPGDTIFIGKDDVKQNVSFWMGVGTFVISLVIAGFVISDHAKK